MKIKLHVVTMLLLLLTTSLFAQEGSLTGSVVSRTNRQPIVGAEVKISGATTKVFKTNSNGTFELGDLPAGKYELTIEALDHNATILFVDITDSERQLGAISLSAAQNVNANQAESEVFDTDMGDNFEYNAMSMTGSKDVYDNIAGYKFSSMRFRNRGYESQAQDVFLNGINMKDAMTGYSPWSLWTGLNDATRSQEYISGGASEYGLGSIGGITHINARASEVRKGVSASTVGANGMYRFRGMFTYGSGIQDNGWSYAVSLSTRQGGNDYTDGTSYNSLSYYASVEKRINSEHNVVLTAFGAPTVRGVQSASTQEAYDLAGSNYYNANVGYQDGELRNARVKNYHEPVVVANYEYTPNDRFKAALAASYRFGTNGYSALDWYDAADPRPDYYRYLPSYSDEGSQSYAYAKEGWEYGDASLLDWDRIYNVNYNSYATAEEVALVNANNDEQITTSSLRSKYVQEERHTDQRDFNLALNGSYILNNNLTLDFGAKYRKNDTEYYKVIKDLLGGDFYIDIDQYAERDFGTDQSLVQNNLATPYNIVKVGDKYGYDYYAHIQNGSGWANLKYDVGFLEAYASGEAGYTSFYREGMFEKGLFPGDASLGDSEKSTFLTHTLKAGAVLKIDARNVISLNLTEMAAAPQFADAFLSARSRNELVDGLTTEKTLSADLNYMFRLGGARFRVTGFYTDITDKNEVISFYDDMQGSYTNFSMTGIDQRHMGAEFGMEVPMPFVTGLTLQGALSWGNYTYTSNPLVTQTVDNSGEKVLEGEKICWEGFYVEGTPQMAANLGFNYNPIYGLYIGIDASFYDNLYLDMNPLCRAEYMIDAFGDDTEGLATMTAQERFDNIFLLNANVSKTWYVGKYMIGLSLDVKNLLNNQNVCTGGYEQMRIKSSEDDNGNTTYTRFDSKYFYMYGTTYYANLYVRF